VGEQQSHLGEACKICQGGGAHKSSRSADQLRPGQAQQTHHLLEQLAAAGVVGSCQVRNSKRPSSSAGRWLEKAAKCFPRAVVLQGALGAVGAGGTGQPFSLQIGDSRRILKLRGPGRGWPVWEEQAIAQAPDHRCRLVGGAPLAHEQSGLEGLKGRAQRSFAAAWGSPAPH